MHTVITQRIEALRDQMRGRGIDATIIPQTDPHQSEYIADHWQTRRWLSGFTGSAGALVVTLDEALLWADSRYWLQADSQLADTGVRVMHEGQPDVPTIAGYLCTTLKPGSTVGIDGMLFSIGDTRSLEATLRRHDIRLVVDFDVIDQIWADRPALPADPVFIHDVKYAGEEARSKVAKILADVARQGADSVFISDLAEIAWTLNVRSRDVESNPVVMAFLYLSPKGSTLFVDPAKLTPEVVDYLKSQGIATAPYKEVKSYLASLPAAEKVLLPLEQSAIALLPILGERMVEGKSPIAVMKGCKNAVQVEGVRQAMVRDGVAMVKALMEIEDKVGAGERLTELGVADILTYHRSQQEHYFDQSFETICGYGPHGAIVHYSATPESDVELRPEGLLLIDSGANYLDGTTDITRTISLGHPTNQQRHDFTLVLCGHIALAEAIYPEGTSGIQLDVLARLPLWREGLTYLHGTGHGVGHFLNVHEGPQRIALALNQEPLRVGMITSNEPGLYRAGEYGIRCENLVLTTEAFTTDFGRFLRFETLTLCPFDLELVDPSIMSYEEVEWLNRYHAMVRERLLPHLHHEKERQWLRHHTREIQKTPI
ncbi:MAG: aminopeptidase P family protein [Bacteroidales bacterium]|nr:aminopeptidase P family protein [Bacteroidales bacterium]